ncbi:hypothetical protein DPMN_023159 [Dreissena polymorpha]|uniref:Uncharacterized protein n=2 Tax=Dreissena polymorpha TaxID=45954 RepID=A0A9D4RBH9_DREPO|nr:hypothetical protein DPMN_023159 [Dreissena polymorpha]
MSFHVSMQASMIIQNQCHLNKCVILFKQSLSTDVTSNRLKLASFLVSTGYLQSALIVLCDIQQRLNAKPIKVCCPCGNRNLSDTLLETFTRYSVGKCSSNENHMALCVRFLKYEAFCVPPALLLEMNRTGIEAEYSKLDRIQTDWDRHVSVDADVFMYYLKYLTYGGLGDIRKQLSALEGLTECIQNHTEELYHLETAYNLLGHCVEMTGHCLELTGLLEKAASVYLMSLQSKPRNNAANWHIRRLCGNTQYT